MLPLTLTGSEWQLYRELCACASLLCLGGCHSVREGCLQHIPPGVDLQLLVRTCRHSGVFLVSEASAPLSLPSMVSHRDALVVYLHQLLFGAQRDVSPPSFAGVIVAGFGFAIFIAFSLTMGALKDVQNLF